MYVNVNYIYIHANPERSKMEPVVNALKTAENWLDARGRTAWVIATVLAFIFAWPIGIALLVYIIWSNKMSRLSARCSGRSWSRESRFSPTGNAAFDAYREETLKRLMDEQEAFQSFLDKLRKAKDQAEFDQFMDDRKRRPTREAQPDVQDVTPTQEAPRNDGGAAPFPA